MGRTFLKGRGLVKMPERFRRRAANSWAGVVAGQSHGRLRLATADLAQRGHRGFRDERIG